METKLLNACTLEEDNRGFFSNFLTLFQIVSCLRRSGLSVSHDNLRQSILLRLRPIIVFGGGGGGKKVGGGGGAHGGGGGGATNVELD